jgi:hypothetical protein
MAVSDFPSAMSSPAINQYYFVIEYNQSMEKPPNTVLIYNKTTEINLTLQLSTCDQSILLSHIIQSTMGKHQIHS